MRVLKEKGFTFVEILIVMVVMGIMAAMVAPNFFNLLPNMRLRAAAREMYSSFQQAKMEAIKRNQNVVMVLAPVTCAGLPNAVPSPGGSYLVFVDDGSGGVLAGNSIQDGAEPTLVTQTMPANTAFCAETFNGTTTGFTPKGLVVNSNIGSATLNNDNNRSYQISLTIAGGIRLQ